MNQTYSVLLLNTAEDSANSFPVAKVECSSATCPVSASCHVAQRQIWHSLAGSGGNFCSIVGERVSSEAHWVFYPVSQ